MTAARVRQIVIANLACLLACAPGLMFVHFTQPPRILFYILPAVSGVALTRMSRTLRELTDD